MINTLDEIFNENGELVSYRLRIKYYLGDGYYVNDIDCYPTKEELIKSL